MGVALEIMTARLDRVQDVLLDIIVKDVVARLRDRVTPVLLTTTVQGRFIRYQSPGLLPPAVQGSTYPQLHQALLMVIANHVPPGISVLGGLPLLSQTVL
jgi:hypothetical protein